MTAAEPGISEDVVRAVRRTLAELGFSDDEPLPASAGGVVPGSAADALFDRAAAALGDEAVALRVALRIPIGSLGAIDYGLSTSPTLRTALHTLARFYSVATQRVRLALIDEPPAARLAGHRLPGIRHSRHWLEFSFAVIATRIRQTLARPDLVFAPVAFAHPAPAAPAAYDAFFGARVAFGTTDCLGFARELLDLPLHTASEPLARLLEQRMRELEPAMRHGDALLDRVRDTLRWMLDEGTTDLDTLARRLGESKRSLQRALHDRSTSHSELLDELRRARATELLDQGLRVADVARRLGFSEPSAFFRAYRRWTGTSPRGASSG